MRRCTRRNKPQLCVYHPAPLTKTSKTASASIPTPLSSESSEVVESASTPTYSAFQPSNSTFSTTLPFSPSEVEASPTLPRNFRAGSLPAQWQPFGTSQLSSERSHRLDSSEFHKNSAFISHSAILFENEVSVGVDLSPSALDNGPHGESGPNQIHIQRGATILGLLKDQPTFDKYIERYFSFTRGIVLIEPMVKGWLSSLWSNYRRILEKQDPAALLQLSEQLWRNTLKPIELTQYTTPSQFVAMTTGKHLRWEVIGILLTIVAQLALSLQDGDPIFCSHDEPPVDRQRLVKTMFNAAEFCIDFCDEFDIMNDLYLWLMYESTVVYCSKRPRGTYANYQRHSREHTAIVAFGLHQEIKPNSTTPFFISELRKRLFIACYTNDKYSAAFIGRPPRLTRHYSLLQLPLDLEDSQLMSDGQTLDSAIQNLDDSGWNLGGKIQHCTFSRIFASNALITEETLEISLGNLPAEEIATRAKEIEIRGKQLYANLPPFLRMEEIDPDITGVRDHNHIWDLRRRAPIELLFLVYIRLADLGHHFLLQRTLIKKAGAGVEGQHQIHTASKKLLAVARQMFMFVLVVIQNRDSIRDFHIDFVQILCMYGVPSSALIAVELLKEERERRNQSQNHHHPRDSCELESDIDIEKVVLPRSETIQDLSVFVSALASLRPSDPSCERGRKFLKRILDTILSPEAPLLSSSSGGNANYATAASVTSPSHIGIAPGGDVSTFNTAMTDLSYPVGIGTAGESGGGGAAGVNETLFQNGDDGEFMRWLELMEWEDGGWVRAGG